MEELMLKIDNVSKQYRLGEIGGTTLRDELQRLSARLRGREDPTKLIGSRDYRKGETFMALDGASFEVRKGERVGIIGHNGAGKSTLLKLISRVTAPTGGDIYLNGRVASMLEVGTGFHGELTGRENIYMNGAILGMTKKEIDAKIEDIIEFSECRQFIDTPVKRYSSGMYVKLAFSVAAHLDSEIMIMDEVLAVGDVNFQQKCLNKMSSISKAEGRTILYVSHNMNTIRQLCNRCVVLQRGKPIFDGDVESGIGYYLSSSADARTRIEYRNIERMSWLTNPLITTISAEIMDKHELQFKQGEPLCLKLCWRNDYDIDQMSLRVEIHRLDGSAVASTMLTGFYSGRKNATEEKTFYIDIDLLAPGKYKFIYSFSVVDRFGNDAVADCVYGHQIEKLSGEGDIEWNNICWGDVILPKMREMPQQNGGV